MELFVIVEILGGIVALLNEQTNRDITIPSLCDEDATLATDKDTKDVLTGTRAVDLLKKKTIPQLCTNLNTEVKKVNVPQLLLTVKVVKPFVELPGVSSGVRTLVTLLAPLKGKSSEEIDPNQFLPKLEPIMKQPGVLTALKKMDGIADVFSSVLEGIGVFPDICTDPKVAKGMTQLLKLIEATSMAKVCGYVKDVAVLGKNLAKLQKVEDANKGVKDPKDLIPQMYLALNLLTPFMRLPGFDSTLRGHMVTLERLLSLKVNSEAFDKELQDSNVMAAAGQLTKSKMKMYLEEVFQAVGTLVEVCPNKKYSKYESLLNLVKKDVNTVKDVCRKVDLDVLRQDLKHLGELSQTSLAIPSFRRSFVESVVYHIVLVALVKLIV